MTESLLLDVLLFGIGIFLFWIAKVLDKFYREYYDRKHKLKLWD